MINSKKIRLLGIAMLIAASNYMGGCSAVGFGTGLFIDNSVSDEKRVEKWECGKISESTETTIYLSNGDVVSGEFAGLEKKTAEEYSLEYSRFQHANGYDFYLPEMGDTLRIETWDGDQGMHRFLGFDYLYKGSGRSLKNRVHALYTNVSASTLNGHKDKYYPIKYLDLIYGKDGKAVTGKELEKLSANTALPLRSRIALRTNAGLEHVNLEDVSAMDVPRNKRARWIGLGLGLVADAFIVAVIIAISSMPSWG